MDLPNSAQKQVFVDIKISIVSGFRPILASVMKFELRGPSENSFCGCAPTHHIRKNFRPYSTAFLLFIKMSMAVES